MIESRRNFLSHMASIAAGSFLLNDVGYASFILKANKNPESIDRKEFSKLYMLEKSSSYLNHASIGTVPRPIHNAHIKYLEICESNPSLYVWGAPWKLITNKTRELAADLLGCYSNDIAITHNTTEGFNILAHGLKLNKKHEVLFSSLNHAGASMSWYGLSKIKNYKVRSFEFPIHLINEMNRKDIINIYKSQIRSNTKVLVLPHIDNIVGLRHPVNEIAREVKSLGVEYVFVDGAQSLGMISIDLKDSQIDAYSMSPHKWLQAPKGTGLFYVNKNLRDIIPKMWYKSSRPEEDKTATKYEDYSTRAWPAVVALGDAIRFHNSLGQQRKDDHYNYLWSETKKIIDKESRLDWLSPSNYDLGSMIMTIGIQGRSSFELSEILSNDYNIHIRPFEKPINALRISPNLSSDLNDIQKLIDVVLKNI